MKKFISNLIMIIGYLLLSSLHFYFAKTRGMDMFQSCSFFILYLMWNNFYNNVIKSCIYGLKW